MSEENNQNTRVPVRVSDDSGALVVSETGQGDSEKIDTLLEEIKASNEAFKRESESSLERITEGILEIEKELDAFHDEIEEMVDQKSTEIEEAIDDFEGKG